MTEKALYAGTFDPITNGHLDIIKRAKLIFPNLTIAVANNQNKNPLFTATERVDLIKKTLASNPELANIEVIDFNGLLVDLAKERNIKILIRGLRAVSDFEYEFQMSCMNSKLSPNIQTIFLPASENAHFISSRFVKQIASFHGDISDLVPNAILTELKNKY
ncbi:MAG: pantetheine-phosphate adenylyltransferase [Rickettsiales bacterium]|nr:pantetheine-phosphate adenylyltransferase [Rickettsiales bacterium]